jgi:hypothetical protein
MLRSAFLPLLLDCASLIPVEEEKCAPTEQTNTITFLLKLNSVGLGQSTGRVFENNCFNLTKLVRGQ